MEKSRKNYFGEVELVDNRFEKKRTNGKDYGKQAVEMEPGDGNGQRENVLAGSPPNILAEKQKIGAEEPAEKAEQSVVQETGEEDKEPEVNVEELKAQLFQANTQAQEYFQRLARLQADFENYRKRSLREREDFLRFASEELIVQLLPIMDNFDRALSFGREKINGFWEGVEMIYKQFGDLLKTKGVTSVPALGEKFDPVKHEAVAWEETNEESEDNIIKKEIRKGYYLQDKVIRPAMVVVAQVKQKEVQEGERVNGESNRY